MNTSLVEKLIVGKVFISGIFEDYEITDVLEINDQKEYVRVSLAMHSLFYPDVFIGFEEFKNLQGVR